MTRAAASSMASGSPSRRRQIAATAAAFSAVNANDGRGGALDEEAHGWHVGDLGRGRDRVELGQRQRGHGYSARPQAQRRPAGGQDLSPGQAASRSATERRLGQMLEVVEHQQHPAGAEDRPHDLVR